MAEIKSTMDLIMEKTKHLTMSEEEKEEFRKKELTGKIKGLVQKYVDGLIHIEKITSEIASEREKNTFQVNGLLKDELIERLEPDGDNEKIFEALADLLGVDTDPLEQTTVEFHNKVAEEKEFRTAGLRKKLAEKGISGSAVVPNPAHDADWNVFYEELISSFKRQLGAIADNQTTGSQ